MPERKMRARDPTTFFDPRDLPEPNGNPGRIK
jgi:hypothetical protein